MSALVSIIIPAYNYAAFLPECVQSLQAQSYAHWECLIVDDGSTDDTRQVAASFLQDPRIRYIYQENAGLSAARNTGLEAAKGDYIQFLDADDKIYPRKLEKQVSQLEKLQGPSMAISDFEYSLPGKKRFSAFHTQHYFEEFVLRVSIPHHCFLFSSVFFKEHQLRYDESLRNHEDWDMLIRMFSLHPALQLSSEVDAWYRVHEKSMTSNLNMRDGLIHVCLKNQALFPPGTAIYQLLGIRARLTRLKYAGQRSAQWMHSLLMKYAVWKYLS